MSPQINSSPIDLGNFTTHFAEMLDQVEKDPELRKELVSPRMGNPIPLGPVVKSAEEWAAKQVKNASAAAAEWEKNVLTPRRDPIQAAIAAAPKRDQKVREALEQKKWEKAMANVNEDLMYATIRKRGASAFRAGVEDRAGKVLEVAKQLQPMVAALKQEIDHMPDVTDADREKRLLAARRGMIMIGKKRRGIA